MKIIKQIQYGDFDSSLEIQATTIPEIKKNEVLIKVFTVSVNPHDVKLASGKLKKVEKLSFPAPVGNDFSGVIKKIGSEVKKVSVGDKVFGITEGALTEYCAVNKNNICKSPSNIDIEKMAAFPVVGMTTIQSFERAGGIKKGDKILIHAGSGGVGSFAIQYAKSKGAIVYTTVGTENIKWIKKLGADICIDYRKEDYLKKCSNLDIVLVTLGGEYPFDAFKIIKNGGKIISLIPAEINAQVADEFKMPKIVKFILSFKPSRIKKLEKSKNAKYQFVFMHPRTKDLQEIAHLVKDNKIKPVIEKIYSFKNTAQAFEHVAAGKSKGKVLIKI